MDGDRDARACTALDPIPRRWVEQLTPGHPAREQAVARLRELLLTASRLRR